jgi:hypothetical protein
MKSQHSCKILNDREEISKFEDSLRHSRSLHLSHATFIFSRKPIVQTWHIRKLNSLAPLRDYLLLYKHQEMCPCNEMSRLVFWCSCFFLRRFRFLLQTHSSVSYGPFINSYFLGKSLGRLTPFTYFQRHH